MDTQTLIKNLNRIFCEQDKKDKKYSRVWLEDADFGGLYNSSKYILNVQAHHNIDSCITEIGSIFSLLNEKAPEELKRIWRVAVYNDEKDLHCDAEIEGFLVYSEEKSCQPPA